MPDAEPRLPPPRIQIESPEPMLDCGRYPAKRTAGDEVLVAADVFRDGHDVLRVVTRFRGPGDAEWREVPMRWVEPDFGGNRWEGTFAPDRVGPWSYTIEAWTDTFATWRREMERKVEAGQDDLSGELSEGRQLVERALARATAPDLRRTLSTALEAWDLDAGLDARVAQAVDAVAERTHVTRLARPLDLDVDRERARVGAWYELFPRSWGGFAGVTEQVPALADLGFDVLYLPPIHPIGVANRKGRNNALTAAPGDPGSPWAIGDATGGHDAIHPELGTDAELRTLIATAREHGIDVALDFAIQCSPDHPWLTEHPEWFQRRPDGTLKYAENPPKKYQDIYNVDWDSPDWRGLWDALLAVVRHWVGEGVRIFRVDNPHTKPLAFWEWLISTIRAEQPDVVFLAEAFTKAAMMRTLAKVGFSQSYTYFTWKQSRQELIDYVVELGFSGMQDYYRPNFFVNTPDILTEQLQHGGPGQFHARLVLAATLSPTYGIYSGYESFEDVAVRPGSEEYLDSEKYEAKARTLDGPLLGVVKRLNTIRREHAALRRLESVRFIGTENESLIAYTKVSDDDAVIVVVNLDPRTPQEGLAVVPYESGLPPSFRVRDLLVEGATPVDWGLGRNYVRLEGGGAHVLEVLR